MNTCRFRAALLGLASGVVAVAAPSAWAGDPEPGRPYSWAGFYVGAHLGSALSDTEWTFADNLQNIAAVSPGTSFSHPSNGFLIGLQGGWQHQWSNWVAGIEVSFSGAALRDSTPIGYAAHFDDTFKTSINELLLVTGRVGYAWDRWLVYAKGGFAGANVDASVVDTGSGAESGGAQSGTAPNSWRSSEWHNGWTVGGGVELKLLPNVSFGLEYSFIDLGSKSHSATVFNSAGGPITGVTATSSAAFDVDPQIQTVTARLNFHLGR